MKRIRIVLVIMVILVAAAIGIYFIADFFNDQKKEKEKAENDKLILFDFDDEACTKLEIHNESGDYVMEYTQADGWVMTDSNKFDANSNTASYICTYMSDLKADKIIEDSDIGKYGFDDPIKLTVTSNGSPYTLLVGSATPTNENYYVMKENDDNIYLIDYAKGVILHATKDSLKSTYLANFLSTEIEAFSLWKGGETDENILFSMNKNDDGTWYMDKPYKDNSVYSSDVSEFLNDAIRDEIYSFVAEDCKKSDYSKYGFDNPQFVFEMSGSGKHVKVIFGDNTDNENEIYGLFTDTGQVVTFYQNNISILNYDTMDMMNTSVYTADINDVTEIELTMPDYNVNLKIDEKNEKYTVNERDIESSEKELTEAFISFYKSFNNAYFESIQKSDEPFGEAEISIVYTLSSNVRTRIDYIPVSGENSNTYWAMKDGEYTGFVVRKKVIANIISSYEVLISAIEESDK